MMEPASNRETVALRAQPPNAKASTKTIVTAGQESLTQNLRPQANRKVARATQEVFGSNRLLARIGSIASPRLGIRKEGTSPTILGIAKEPQTVRQSLRIVDIKSHSQPSPAAQQEATHS